MAESQDEKAGFMSRIKAFKDKVKASKFFQYGILGLRMVDWASDFTLLIAFTVIFTYLPDFYVAQNKPDSLRSSVIQFGLKDVNHYCEMEFSYEPSECSDSGEYTRKISHNQFKAGITNYCPDVDEDTYIYVTYHNIDKSDWTFSPCCIRSDLNNNDMDMELIVNCDKGSSKITAHLVISESVPWLCSLDENNYSGSGYRASRCTLTDPMLLNTLTMFAFVIIAKELLVIVSYEFCIFYLEQRDLVQLSSDSLLLLAVSIIRMTKWNRYITKGTMKVSDNRVFFLFWGILDFTEKIVSATITYIILTAVFNWLILLVFVSSLLSFLLSLKFWYSRIQYFLMKEILGRRRLTNKDEDEDNDEDAQETIRLPKVPIESINSFYLPEPNGWDKFTFIFTYNQLVIPVIRGGFVIAILWGWTILQYQDYVLEDNQIYVRTKFLGAAFLVFVFAEYGLISTHFALARKMIHQDILKAFMKSWSRNSMAQISLRHHAMIRRVQSKLPQGVMRAITVFESPHLAEPLVYFGEGLNVYFLSEIVKDFIDKSGEENIDRFKTFRYIMLVYAIWSLVDLVWTVAGILFRNRQFSKIISTLCFIGKIDITEIRKSFVPIAFLSAVNGIFDESFTKSEYIQNIIKH